MINKTGSFWSGDDTFKIRIYIINFYGLNNETISTVRQNYEIL